LPARLPSSPQLQPQQLLLMLLLLLLLLLRLDVFCSHYQR
jgi:hypothetical protein